MELRVFQAGFGHRNKRREDGCFLAFLGCSYMLFSLVCDFLSHLLYVLFLVYVIFNAGAKTEFLFSSNASELRIVGKDRAWGFYGLRLMKGLAAAMARSKLLFKPYSHSSY